MALLKVVHTLAAANGLAEDAVTNQLVVANADPDPVNQAQLLEVALQSQDLYTAVTANGQSLGNYLSGKLSRTADECITKIYDIEGHLNGSPHGSPIFEDTFTLPAASVAAVLPEEVACVATLEAIGRLNQPVEATDAGDADALPDRPRQRYTGRIYIGPLNQGAIDNATGRPSAAFRTVVLDAIEATELSLVNANALFPWHLMIWSRKDSAIRQIEAVSVDDAFDTQRRRGVAATVRTRRLL